jgi:3-methyladenine DNA glycosylase AlkD
MSTSATISRIRKFQKAIKIGKYSEAVKLANLANDLSECEIIASATLWDKKAPKELLTATLHAFASVYNNPSVMHGAWVHSASHLLWKLWERRLIVWIKEFHRISFQGAREQNNPTCCDRLVDRFVQFAKWSDDPIKFHLTSENIELVEKRWLFPHAESRVKEAPFKSDVDFLRWQFKHPEAFYERYDVQIPNVSFKRVRKRVETLKKNGIDVSEFTQMEQQLVASQLKQLKKLLKNSQSDWETKNIAGQIAKIADFLAVQTYRGQEN